MNSKRIQKVRLFFAILIAILYIAGFLGFFYPIKLFNLNITPLIQKNLTDFTIFSGIFLLFVIVITILFGRIYCSTLCPLGLFQELCLALSHPKKLPQQKNRAFKYIIAGIFLGTLFSGTVIVVRLIDPYTIFGSALSGTIYGLVALIIIGIITGFKGRYFCTNFCPIGAILGIISRYSYNKIYIKKDSCVACGLCAQKCPSGCIDYKNKTINNETCIKCFKCLNLCHNQGITYGHQTTKNTTITPAFSASRRRFIISAATLASFTAAYKVGINIISTSASKIKNILLPPGAKQSQHFANKCLNCNLCVENCPMKIIKKKNQDIPTVHIELGKNFCSYNCNKCSEVCPSGAIKKQSLQIKRQTQIGIARVNPDVCMQCGLCVLECPRSAITKQQRDFPTINPNMCIGCGSCQAICPVSAIKVTPVETQKILPK